MFSCRVLLRPRGGTSIARCQPIHDCHCSRGLERFSSMLSWIPQHAENRDGYTVDGRNRIADLMQHNIGLYRELKTAQKLRCKDMSVDIAGRHTLQYSHLNYFTTQGLAYTEAVCRRYIADNVKPLWWRTSAIGSSAKPVVRNKATARMNVAFRQALRNAGYDIQGRRLPDQKNGPRSGDKAITHLFGTVVIKSHVPIRVCAMPFEDLQGYCERVVRVLEQALGQHPGGPGRGTQTSPRQQDPGRSSGGNRGGGGSNGGRGGQANKAGPRSRR